MLSDLGFEPGAIPGPDYWVLPNGRTLYEEARSVEEGDPPPSEASDTRGEPVALEAVAAADVTGATMWVA